MAHRPSKRQKSKTCFNWYKQTHFHHIVNRATVYNTYTVQKLGYGEVTQRHHSLKPDGVHLSLRPHCKQRPKAADYHFMARNSTLLARNGSCLTSSYQKTNMVASMGLSLFKKVLRNDSRDHLKIQKHLACLCALWCPCFSVGRSLVCSVTLWIFQN